MDFIHAMLQQVASFAEISWAKPMLAYLPLNKAKVAKIKQFHTFSDQNLSKRINTQGSAEIDVLGFLMTAGKKNSAQKLSDLGLGSETRLVIAAGTDTTSIAITYGQSPSAMITQFTCQLSKPVEN